MKFLHLALLPAYGAFALAGAAYAQVPSTNDKSDANGNTGSGTDALGFGDSNAGNANTAVGSAALRYNITGISNTAIGLQSMYFNTTGSFNTVVGVMGLLYNTSGEFNVADGYTALYRNTTGRFNTASGALALTANTTGDKNAAIGWHALYFNTKGSNNTASGAGALYSNTTGVSNTASGFDALYTNRSGRNNTAAGQGALHANTTGSDNIAFGFKAGSSVTTGSNNIEIGNQGTESDNNTIKIGTQGLQAATFVAGIYNVPVSGNTVVVNSSGQLGVQAVSSERFKSDITPMGSSSSKFDELRPVTFRLKTDPKGTLQYGLIAEQVARVYPELVIHSESGRIDGIRYDELAPILLNEVQAQQRKIDAQAAEIRNLKLRQSQFVTQRQLQDLKQQLRAVVDKQGGNDSFVAQR